MQMPDGKLLKSRFDFSLFPRCVILPAIGGKRWERQDASPRDTRIHGRSQELLRCSLRAREAGSQGGYRKSCKEENARWEMLHPYPGGDF